MRGFRRVALVLFPALAACSPQLTPDRGAIHDDLESIHSRVVECRGDFERGIELVLAGDDSLGRDVLEASARRMAALAEECARTERCDMRVFDLALGRVFRERNAGARRSVAAAAATWTAPMQPSASPAVASSAPHADSPIVEAIPQIGRTVSLLNGTDLRDLIELNEPVMAAMYGWLTWDRPELAEAYENYCFMRRNVAPVYEEAGLPEALLFAVMATETGAKVHAYSRAGAAGPLQFMRHTGRRYGLNYVDGFDMRYDPVAAARASAAYLDDRFEEFNHDLEKALAAYNVGETRMRKLDRKLDGAAFWDPRMLNELPEETRDYVPQVLAAAWLFLHPDEYDLEFPRYENDTTDVELVDDLALGELSICLGDAGYPKGWYRTLRNLNPRLSGTKRAPAGSGLAMPSRLVPVYARQCVKDAPRLALARGLHEATFPR